MVLFSGLLGYCEPVLASVDTSGRPYRTPARADGPQKHFSRDMTLGLIRCLHRTKDVATAARFVEYVRENDYRLCPPEDDPDGRCKLSPVQHRTIWAILGQLYKRLGLTRTWEMIQAGGGDDTILEYESNWTPVGYQLHLVAIKWMIRKELGDPAPSVIMKNILDRQPENLYYKWLRGSSRKEIAEDILRVVPRFEPDRRHQWSWQRDTAEMAWLDSMGWDMIFLIDEVLHGR